MNFGTTIDSKAQNPIHYVNLNDQACGKSDVSEDSGKVEAVQHLLSTILTAQKALRALAPDYRWSGLGNLMGDFGEYVSINHYGLRKAPRGASGYDALTGEGKTVQIKTNFAASEIGFRGEADLMLVIGVNEDGSWRELYFGPFGAVKDEARYSARDNKHMLTLTKLRRLSGDQ